jgi:hypothetical protein
MHLVEHSSGQRLGYLGCAQPSLTVSLLLLASLALGGCSDAPILIGAPTGERSSAIAHGSIDPGHPAVGLLNIKYPDGTGYYCTGGLVGSRTVLTAAHCVVKGKSAPYTSPSSIHFYING